jgi:hypothetical protein
MRQQIQTLEHADYNKLNAMYKERKMSGFWNAVKRKQRKRVSTTLKMDSLSHHYQKIMQDSPADTLSNDQRIIADQVLSLYDMNSNHDEQCMISPCKIETIIRSLKRNSAPGIDGITGEHLKFGLSPLLCSHLAALYSAIFSWSVVPHIFTIGIIIPVIKKPSLDPNAPDSYRPITLSSTMAKVCELMMIPEDKISPTQFGFRKGRGTGMACSLLNDVLSYFKNDKTPVFL